MPEIELREGVATFSPDGEQLGRLSRFVLDPSTNELTHIVIQGDGPTAEERVVPLEWIRLAAEDRVVLSDRIGVFNQLPRFQEAQFVQVNDQAGWKADRQTGFFSCDPEAPVYYWYPPRGHPGFPVHGLGARTWPPAKTALTVPAHTVPMQEKTNVISSDGKLVGDVERLFLEPDSDKVTHFLISQGLFFEDHKLIPAGWIESADEEVHLSVPSEVLQRLPAYEL